MNTVKNLILELLKLPKETTWVEFKHNNYTPDMIGKDISALANSAALEDRDFGYMIWGIDDDTHDIVGTDFDSQSELVGSQEIESWLRNLVSKNTDFTFESIFIDGKKVTVLKIKHAISQTSTFKKVEYIRIGSYTKPLAEYTTLKQRLWEKLGNKKIEETIVSSRLSAEQVLGVLDFNKYFKLMQKEQPQSLEEIIYYLKEENMVRQDDDGSFAITYLGAILLAKDLNDFPSVSRKAIRVVKYSGNNRTCGIQEYTNNTGYAVGFEEVLTAIKTFLEEREIIDGALRKEGNIYPNIAIRELLANALIHQDFSIHGSGPLVEIFSDRMEISNPGNVLVDINRIIDNPPRSRNEKLASCMRRMHICEELGTGWDKIVISCEAMYLPAPKITSYEDNTRATIYSMIPYGEMLLEDKIRGCYLHTCIKWVQNEKMTNKSLRERFNVEKRNMSSISRLIKTTTDAKLIKPHDPYNTSPKKMGYIPYWA